MATFLENSYSLVHQDNVANTPTMQELKTQLEKGSDEIKIDTMKRILTIMLNGDPLNGLLMHIIRFIMPSKSKPLKKLLYLYYEVCPKHDANGKLKQEMILVWYVPGSNGVAEPGLTDTAMESDLTCNIPMNSFEAIHYDFCVSYARPNLLSHCSLQRDSA